MGRTEVAVAATAEPEPLQTSREQVCEGRSEAAGRSARKAWTLRCLLTARPTSVLSPPLAISSPSLSALSAPGERTALRRISAL